MLRRFSTGAMLWLLAVAIPASAETKLQLKFKTDDKFYLEEVDTLKQNIEFMNIKQQQETETTTVYSFTIKKADKDGTVLEQKIENIKVKSKGGPGAASVPGLDEMQKLKGTIFTITLNPAGQITKFEGYDDMIKKLTKGNETVGKLMRDMLSEDVMKQGYLQAFGFLPDKPVDKGAEWKREMQIPLGPLGTFRLDNAYKYEGKGADGEEISVVPAVGYTAPKNAANLPFKITKGNFKAENAKGSIVFDNAAGRLVRQELSMKIKGSMTIDLSGTEGVMNLEQDQVTKIRLLDKDPEK